MAKSFDQLKFSTGQVKHNIISYVAKTCHDSGTQCQIQNNTHNIETLLFSGGSYLKVQSTTNNGITSYTMQLFNQLNEFLFNYQTNIVLTNMNEEYIILSQNSTYHFLLSNFLMCNAHLDTFTGANNRTALTSSTYIDDKLADFPTSVLIKDNFLKTKFNKAQVLKVDYDPNCLKDLSCKINKIYPSYFNSGEYNAYMTFSNFITKKIYFKFESEPIPVPYMSVEYANKAKSCIKQPNDHARTFLKSMQKDVYSDYELLSSLKNFTLKIYNDDTEQLKIVAQNGQFVSINKDMGLFVDELNNGFLILFKSHIKQYDQETMLPCIGGTSSYGLQCNDKDSTGVLMSNFNSKTLNRFEDATNLSLKCDADYYDNALSLHIVRNYNKGKCDYNLMMAGQPYKNYTSCNITSFDSEDFNNFSSMLDLYSYESYCDNNFN